MPKKLILPLTPFLLITLAIMPIEKTYSADITPPVTTYTQTPSSPDGSNGWYVSVVDFEISSTDIESGIKEMNYRIDGGTWQKTSFTDTLNLAPNSSFDIPSATSTGLESWEVTTPNADTSYAQETTDSAPGFGTNSAIISSSAPASEWRGINHYGQFAPTTAYDNMTASVWLKTQNVTEDAYFKVYAIAPDGAGGETIQEIAQSAVVSGTSGWTKVELSFTVALANANGIYLDIGLTGEGTVLVDAVTLNSSTTGNKVQFSVGSESENHTVEFYAVDNADNVEFYSCTTPITNCVTFKSDLTSPGNWHDSGAFRGIFGSSHELYVYTNVDDATSGLSVFTDKYQYKTDNNTTFGRYSNLIACNSTWQEDDWVILISPPFSPGAKTSFLLTPKTDFCNSNWKVCKIVRFFAEDLAGNSTTKDFCLNGPWLSFTEGGFVGTNANIDMLAEPDGDNTDSLVEIGGNSIEFFSTSKDWKARNLPQKTFYLYDDYWNLTEAKTDITGSEIPAASGVYSISGDFTFSNSTIDNQYFGGAPFNQIIFVDGDATIEVDIRTADETAVLAIVSGDVFIDEKVDRLEIGIIADGNIETAYNATDNKPVGTLRARGIYNADVVAFQRTLQGTNNNDSPSEEYVYEAKYLVQLNQFFNNNRVRWKSVE